MHTRISSFVVLLAIAGLFSTLAAAQTYTANLGTNLGDISYSLSQETFNCQYTTGGGYIVPAQYTYLFYTNITYQNSAVTPSINQSMGSFTDIVGSPGPNAGTNDSCPANTTNSVTYKGSTYTAYFDGVTAYVEIPGYINPKYVVTGILYAPPGSASFAKYTNSNLVSSTVTTKNSFGTSYSLTTADLLSGSGVLPYKLGTIDTSSKVSNSYTQATTTTDSTAVTIQTTSSYSHTAAGPVCDYCGVDHDYDLIAVWLNPVQLYTVWGINNLAGKITETIQPNGYGFSTFDTPGLDVYYVYAGELNGDLPMRSSTCCGSTSAFARSWAGASNGFTYASGQGPALTAQDQLNILLTDPFWNCTYKSPVGDAVDCPLGASTNFSGTVNTNGTAITWVSGSKFNSLLDQAQIVINGANYTVAQVNSATSLTLLSSAGAHSGVAYSAPSRFTQSTNNNFPYAQVAPGAQPTPTDYQWSYTTTNTTGTDVTHTFTEQYALEQVFGVKLFGIGFQKTVTQTWTTTQTYETSSQFTNSNTSSIEVSITGVKCNVVSGNCNPVYPPLHAFNPITCMATSLATAFGQGDNMFVYQDNLFGTFLVEPYGQP